MDKLKALLDVFRKGGSVANPAAWKTGQITATALGAFFIALAQLSKAFGHEFPLDTDTATAVAGGIVALVNWLLTLATSKHVGVPGLLPTQQPAPEPVPSPAPASAPAAAPVSPQVPRIDDATRRRAEAWLREQQQYERAGG